MEDSPGCPRLAGVDTCVNSRRGAVWALGSVSAALGFGGRLPGLSLGPTTDPPQELTQGTMYGKVPAHN